jgi:hypothetical protein
MSLQDLTEARMAGRVPPMVWVIVGDKPRAQIEGPAVVAITPKDDVRRMDLRALIGLHVDVFELGDHPELFDAAVLAVDAAKPKTTGLSTAFGVSGLNEKHEAVLRRARELLWS